MIARKLVDNSLKRDHQVDTKCGIKFKFSQIKKEWFLTRFSYSKVDF